MHQYEYEFKKPINGSFMGAKWEPLDSESAKRILQENFAGIIEGMVPSLKTDAGLIIADAYLGVVLIRIKPDYPVTVQHDSGLQVTIHESQIDGKLAVQIESDEMDQDHADNESVPVIRVLLNDGRIYENFYDKPEEYGDDL